MRTSPEERARFIAGLRELADYLAVHPSIPVPDYPRIMAHADGSDDERRQAVDQAAPELNAEASEILPGSGHYTASRYFGPIEYGVLAISQASAELFKAQQSYADNIAVTA